MSLIHGHTVSFDKEHSSLREAAYHLEHTMGRDKAQELFSKAKNSSDGKAHFTGPGGAHFKLKRENGQYTIAKSDNY